MNVGKVSAKSYSGVNYGLAINKIKKQNTVFNGKIENRIIRNTGYTLMAALILSLTSCLHKSRNEESDKSEITREVLSNKTSEPLAQKRYYYFPTADGVISPDQYDWSEIVYPDGTIVKDSLNHKIRITPEGYRTDIKTEKDEQGNVYVTKIFPDKSRIERIDYKPTMENEKISVEKKFRYNNTIAEIKYYNEYPSDSTNVKSEKKIEESHFYYNEKEVLVKWISNVPDPERDIKNNKYDRKKRLIYDDVKNEHYKYKGSSTVPYSSISVFDDCKRITLYNKDGSIKRIYFKASDGTVTEG